MIRAIQLALRVVVTLAAIGESCNTCSMVVLRGRLGAWKPHALCFLLWCLMWLTFPESGFSCFSCGCWLRLLIRFNGIFRSIISGNLLCSYCLCNLAIGYLIFEALGYFTGGEHISENSDKLVNALMSCIVVSPLLVSSDTIILEWSSGQWPERVRACNVRGVRRLRCLNCFCRYGLKQKKRKGANIEVTGQRQKKSTQVQYPPGRYPGSSCHHVTIFRRIKYIEGLVHVVGAGLLLYRSREQS